MSSHAVTLSPVTLSRCRPVTLSLCGCTVRCAHAVVALTVCLMLCPPQRLNESMKYTFVETLIALLMFHEELGSKAMLLFMFKFFLKFFHVVAECRVEFLDLDQATTRKDHIRLTSLCGILFAVDALTFALFFSIVHAIGVSTTVLFAFEVRGCGCDSVCDGL